MSVRPHCVRLLYSFLSVRPRGCNYNCKYLLLFFFFEVFNRYEKSPPRIHFIMETKISRVLFRVESWSYGNFFPENPTLGKRTQNRGFFFHFISDYHGSDRKYATNHSRARSVTFRFWAEGGFTLFVCYCQYVYHQKTLSNPNTFILCLFQICTCRYYKENNFRKRLTLEMAKTRFRQTRGLLFFFFWNLCWFLGKHGDTLKILPYIECLSFEIYRCTQSQIIFLFVHFLSDIPAKIVTHPFCEKSTAFILVHSAINNKIINITSRFLLVSTPPKLIIFIPICQFDAWSEV